ncbi:MAG: choice-of-anchor B family protein, partial [Psychrobium sp.]|nr:choice-of-anchor B family protein [Psychrobium sp.]
MKVHLKHCLTLLIILNVLLIPPEVKAHAEHDKSRFVAPTGIDIGLCDNPLRPCASIKYAVSRASKGDKVLLATGKYHIDSVDDLFALKSQLVPILGGYNRFDHFKNQSPGTNITKLTGIPDDMLISLRSKGFSVIVDGKNKLANSTVDLAIKRSRQSNKSHNATACLDDMAAEFPCKNIDLIAHVSLKDFGFRPGDANDIWGHVDLNTGTEYAIIGIINGVAIFDLSDPEKPREVGAISGVNSTWRDIKVYQYFDKALNTWQAFAYVTIDGKKDFVSIIDLNQLPLSVSLVKKDTAVTKAHNVYISDVDYSLNIALPGATPLLHLVGAPLTSDGYKGSFISFSLDDPKTLGGMTQGANFGNGYTHDGTSMRIDDARKDTDCVNSGETCTIFMDFNEKEIKLWDITKAGKQNQLASFTYFDVPDASKYVHSGWWSEDKRYLFVHDEFDEIRGGLNSTVRIFDLQSLTNPVLAGKWTGPVAAIDHNGFVRGNRYYMSNYTRGLTILDITDPANPIEVGFFDTFPQNDLPSFNGAWGVYPFLPSGIILVSDISGGLFILRDNTRVVDQGNLGFESSELATEQNNTLTITVTRTAMRAGATTATVAYEIIPGSAQPDSDYQTVSGILIWQDDDNTNKTFTIDINGALNETEFSENFFVRLYNPTSGATLGQHSYVTINIDGKENNGLINFTSPNISVNEDIGEVTLYIHRSGAAQGAVSASYLLESGSGTVGDDIAAISGTVSWLDGENTPRAVVLSIINDSLKEGDENLTLILTAIDNSNLGTYDKLIVTIKDDESNSNPLIRIKEDFEVSPMQTVSISGDASDVDGDVITYQWQQVSGTSVSLINGDTNVAIFVVPETAGTLVFKLIASDGRGGSAEKE